MKVFKIVYESLDGIHTWTAHILAKSREEAEELLLKKVTFKFRINTFDDICNVDAITDSIVNSILDLDKKIKKALRKPYTKKNANS